MKYWTRAWSLVEGCSYVSPGCAHCWAAQGTHRKAGQANPKIKARYGGLTDAAGHWTGEIRLMNRDLLKPERWRQPQVVAIWNDLLHEDVPKYFIRQAIGVMELTPRHTWLLFTKRPQRLVEVCGFYGLMLPPNVWPIISVEHQAYLDHRLTQARLIKAWHLVVNLEPLLGPVDLSDWINGLDGVLCGGESGRGARPMHPDWVRKVRDLAGAAGRPFFFKQWGEYLHENQGAIIPAGPPPRGDINNGPGSTKGYLWRDGWSIRIDKKAAGRVLDGRTWDELPWRTNAL